MPARTAIRVVPLRARALSANVAVSLFARIVTIREPAPTVRLPTFDRQLTRTLPLRAIDPLTRSRRPRRTAVIFVRLELEPAPAAGTVIVASAALCEPPLPCASSNHNRTVYSPGRAR